MSKAAVATLENWRDSPQNRWAFRNVERLIACTPVACDPDGSVPLESTSPLRNSPLRSLLINATSTDAIVMLVEGRIVFETYANGNDVTTPHILMSATKAVTGLIAAMLAERGALEFERAVSAYVPEIAHTAYRTATLRQLADMRCGVLPDGAQERAYGAATGWNPTFDGAPGGLHAFFASLPASDATHGGPFSYVSANTDLLGWAIERATQRSLASLVSEMLWKPMGAQSNAYLTTDAHGAPRNSGGLCATVRDVARLGDLVARGAGGIVSAAIVDDLARGGDADAWTNGQWGKAFAPISKRMSYRNGWYADDAGKWLFAMGIYGQNLFIDREQRIVIAKFSSWKQPTDYAALPLTHYLAATLRQAQRKAARRGG